MSFCLDDGSELLFGPASMDEPVTAILSGVHLSRESATKPQLKTTDQAATLPPVITEMPKRGLDKRLLAVPFLLVIIVVAGFFGYRYFGSSAKQIESIAVMPFVNDSGNAEVEYLSDGMTETLISSLSKLTDLDVKPRSAVFRYKGKETDAQAIGKELNVQAVLSGRLTQRGDDISLYAELIDVVRNKAIWSDTYNRKKSELVALQSQITRDVSGKLKTKISGADEAKITKTYTTNPEAYQLFLQGNYYQGKVNKESYSKAIEFYDKAIEKDPNYALAYVGKGYAYNTAANWYLPTGDSMPKAKAAALKAIEIDDSLAEAYGLLGIYEVWYGMDWDACERNFKRSIDLGATTTHDGYGYYLLIMGRTEQAIAELTLARDLNPLGLNANSNAAFGYIVAGMTGEAMAQARRTIELDPNYWAGYETLGVAYAVQGEYPKAISALEKARSLDANSDILGYLGWVYGLSGDVAKAHKLINEMTRASPDSYIAEGSVACIYAGLGDNDKAIEWLERGYASRGSLAMINRDPPFEKLHSDPRFKDLLKRLKVPE